MSDSTESDGLVAETKIEINLNRLSQLFNSLDPSPFHERDLDQDAEDLCFAISEIVVNGRCETGSAGVGQLT